MTTPIDELASLRNLLELSYQHTALLEPCSQGRFLDNGRRSVGQAQLVAAIFSALLEAGGQEDVRDLRLSVLASILKRPITSTKDLTKGEASVFINWAYNLGPDNHLTKESQLADYAISLVAFVARLAIISEGQLELFQPAKNA